MLVRGHFVFLLYTWQLYTSMWLAHPSIEKDGLAHFFKWFLACWLSISKKVGNPIRFAICDFIMWLISKLIMLVWWRTSWNQTPDVQIFLLCIQFVLHWHMTECVGTCDCWVSKTKKSFEVCQTNIFGREGQGWAETNLRGIDWDLLLVYRVSLSFNELKKQHQYSLKEVEDMRANMMQMNQSHMTEMEDMRDELFQKDRTIATLKTEVTTKES